MTEVSHYTRASQRVIPYAADGVTVTPNATAWANSAWAELSTGLGSILVVGFSLLPGDLDNTHFIVDIGTGVSGSEVVAGTINSEDDASAKDNQFWFLQFPIPIRVTDNRVSVRMRKAGVTTAAWQYKMSYYVGPPPPVPEGLRISSAFGSVSGGYTMPRYG